MGSDDDDMPVLKRIEADLQNTVLASPDSKHVDLFSEIHLNELKKLEKQLEQVIIHLVAFLFYQIIGIDIFF